MSAGVWKTSHSTSDPWDPMRVPRRARDPAPYTSRVVEVEGTRPDLAPSTDRLIALRARADPQVLAVPAAFAPERSRVDRRAPWRPGVVPPALVTNPGHRPIQPAAPTDESALCTTDGGPEQAAEIADMDGARRALGRIRDELATLAPSDLVLRISRTPRNVARLLA